MEKSASEGLLEFANAVAKFYDSNLNVDKKLQNVFGSKFTDDLHYEIIKRISKNMKQFNIYLDTTVNKNYDFVHAFSQALHIPNPIITYFYDIHLYAIINNIDSLESFNKQMNDNKLITGQIIVNYQGQKFMVVCGDAEPVVQELQKYISTYFVVKADVIRDCGQIYMNINSPRRINSADELVQSTDFLRDDVDDLAKLTSSLFKLYERNAEINNYDALKLINLIKTSGIPISIPINVTVNGDHNNVNINTNDIITDQKCNNHLDELVDDAINDNIAEDVDEIVEIKKTPQDNANDWIRNNPPNHKEITTNYYKRYSDQTKNPIQNKHFCKLVRDAGFDVVKNNSYRYWTKK